MNIIKDGVAASANEISGSFSSHDGRHHCDLDLTNLTIFESLAIIPTFTLITQLGEILSSAFPT